MCLKAHEMLHFIIFEARFCIYVHTTILVFYWSQSLFEHLKHTLSNGNSIWSSSFICGYWNRASAIRLFWWGFFVHVCVCVHVWLQFFFAKKEIISYTYAAGFFFITEMVLIFSSELSNFSFWVSKKAKKLNRNVQTGSTLLLLMEYSAFADKLYIFSIFFLFSFLRK